MLKSNKNKILYLILFLVLTSFLVFLIFFVLKKKKLEIVDFDFYIPYGNNSKDRPENCTIDLHDGILLEMGVTNEQEYNKLVGNLKTIDGVISVTASGKYGQCHPRYTPKCEPRIHLILVAADREPFILQGALTQIFQALLKDLNYIEGVNDITSKGITGSGYTEEGRRIIDQNDLDYYDPQIKGQTIVIHLDLNQISMEKINKIEEIGDVSAKALSASSGRKINSKVSVNSELPYIPTIKLKMETKDPKKTDEIVSSVEQLSGIKNFGTYVQLRCFERTPVNPDLY